MRRRMKVDDMQMQVGIPPQPPCRSLASIEAPTHCLMVCWLCAVSFWTRISAVAPWGQCESSLAQRLCKARLSCAFWALGGEAGWLRASLKTVLKIQRQDRNPRADTLQSQVWSYQCSGVLAAATSPAVKVEHGKP